MSETIESPENLRAGEYVSVLARKVPSRKVQTLFGEVEDGGGRESARGLVFRVLAVSPPYVAMLVYPEPGAKGKPSVFTMDSRRVSFVRLNQAYVAAMLGDQHVAQEQVEDAPPLHEDIYKYLLSRTANDSRPA